MKLFEFRYRCNHCIRLFYEDEVKEWLDSIDSNEVVPVCPFCESENITEIYHNQLICNKIVLLK